MSKDIPHIPDGGRSAGDGMPPLQMVIGMNEGKDFHMTAVFLVPHDENIFLNQPRGKGLKWKECWLCLHDSKYLGDNWIF